jgi:hypothetical protein
MPTGLHRGQNLCRRPNMTTPRDIYAEELHQEQSST